MKIEEQVCSLEFAIELNKKEVKQESLFWWVEHYSTKDFNFIWKLFSYRDEGGLVNKYISAFTSSELSGELSQYCIEEEIFTGFDDQKGYFCGIYDYDAESFSKSFHSDTEVNARAKMLLYLLELKNG